MSEVIEPNQPAPTDKPVMSVSQITHLMALQGMLHMTAANFDYLMSGLQATAPFMSVEDIRAIADGGDVELMVNKYNVEIVQDSTLR